MADTESTTTRARVAVIGAGASGLTAAKALHECGLDAQLFEASSDIGGQWNLKSPGSAVWPSLYMNQSRRLMEFSDFPWEAAIPSPAEKDFAGLYPSASEAKEYLDAYANKFCLRRLIKFNTFVKKATKKEDNKWHLLVYSDKNGEETLAFDFMVVAKGMNQYPHDPLNEKGGPLINCDAVKIHSSKFKEVIDKIKGKRVLVIGNNVSGLEIATEAVLHRASHVTHSFRKPRYNIETLALTENGKYRAADEVMFSRLPVWLGKVLPESMNAQGLKSLVEQYWRQPTNVDDCFNPDPDISKASASISRLPYNKYIESGELTLKPLPASSKGRMVTFTDGSSQEFDIIISATGYELNLSFLPDSIVQNIVVDTGKDKFLALYKHTMVPSDSTIAFVCMFRMIGGAFPTAEIQSRWIAQIFSKQLSLPDRSIMHDAIEKWKAKRTSCPLNEYALLTEVNEDIAHELGITSNACSIVMDFNRRLLGPIYPCEYRAFSKLEDEEVRDAALETFEKYSNKPKFASLNKREMTVLRIK